jgi:hypothetical protein
MTPGRGLEGPYKRPGLLRGRVDRNRAGTPPAGVGAVPIRAALAV